VNKKYTQWILDIVGDCRWEQTPTGLWRIAGANTLAHVNGEPLIQRCDVAAPLMAKAFPELIIVYGSYRHPVSTVGHWMYHVWCTTPEGTVVDPTGRQFDTRDRKDSYLDGEYQK